MQYKILHNVYSSQQDITQCIQFDTRYYAVYTIQYKILHNVNAIQDITQCVKFNTSYILHNVYNSIQYITKCM